MNRLSGAASAYLASAAHQPVHWYSWSDEAFAAARAQGRPILLDIGAVWCHWCHVMDRESYEDPRLAAFLNERYVCIKVDRDERPDVDARYQRAVQALAGQGGWPLTAFLTPDGDVFFGGTYFPPDERLGRTPFRTVLERVLEAYRTQPDRVRASAGELRSRVGASLVEGEPGDLSAAMLNAAADRIAGVFDFRNGGFGSQPKFPHPSAIEFVLARWWDTGAPRMREIVERTLTGMALGGVHDQLGGGFHRYSVDARWIVPHFEKMAYDNAELLKAYLHAYSAFGTPLYRDVAEGIVRWNLEVMCDPERGGFAASQDADISLDDDGDYFTWSVAEAEAALPEGERTAARLRWGIDPEGEMHHDPRRNVLHVARTTSQVAAEMGVGEADVVALLVSAAAKMRAARARRTAPFVDRAVYTNWNAMMAEAFLEASAVLGREDCRAFALQTLERLWAEAWQAGIGMAHRAGAAAPAALLDDQVQAASAAIAAFEHTGAVQWLERAQQLARLVVERFRDPRGGFCDTAESDGTGFLSQRARPIQDAPTPSPNAVAALVFLRLHAVTGEPGYRTEAEAALRAFAGGAADLGLYAATYFRAADWFLSGGCSIVVADTTTTDLAATALATYRPRKVVVPTPSPVTSHVSPLNHHLSPMTHHLLPPFALVCSGTACTSPARTASELRQTMESFGRSR
jgi:uncharacterized protein YyaL (SSP411 family)